MKTPLVKEKGDQDNGEDITKQLQRWNHFFSQKQLQDPNFIYGSQLNSAKSTRNKGADPGKDTFLKLCKGALLTQPSRIQALAWPVLCETNIQKRPSGVVIADQTGSGKTLSYLLPLLQRLKDKERSGADGSQKGNFHNAPQILILAPTTELAHQIHSVCKRLSTFVPFRSEVMTATPFASEQVKPSAKEGKDIEEAASSQLMYQQMRTLTDTNKPSLDVLIGTPGRIASLLRSKAKDKTPLLDVTSRLDAIVLDEVDMLMVDTTFGEQLQTVGKATASSQQTQFVFVTATLPDSVVETVYKEFGGPSSVKVIKGPGLHKIAPTVSEYLVDVSLPPDQTRNQKLANSKKVDELSKALLRNKSKHSLVFCNTVESCRVVENFLNRRDKKNLLYQVYSYHGAMASDARNRALRGFCQTNDSVNQRAKNPKVQRGQVQRGQLQRPSSNQKGRNNNNNKDRFQQNQDVDRILICTDRAARGADFGGTPIDHVIIFDFPRDPAEYIRRVGRTARAGRDGTCTVFAYGWQLPIARQVMTTPSQTQSVDGKSLNKKKPSSLLTEGSSGPWNDDDDEEDSFFHGQRTRPNNKKRIKEPQSNDTIASNIASGQMWKERKGSGYDDHDD
jgi:ATP-dependent RNA helicase DDX18/HAS1